jgi:hypothetical protein
MAPKDTTRAQANVNVKHKLRVSCTVEARDIKEAAREIRARTSCEVRKTLESISTPEQAYLYKKKK